MFLLRGIASKRTAKWSKALLIMIILTVVSANIGCNSSHGNLETTATSTTVGTTVIQMTKAKTLDIEVEKVFPKVGFRFLLSVRDGNGQSIAPEGQIVADAYMQIGNALGAGKDRLVYEWIDLSVTRAEYDTTLEGSPVVLEWGEFHIISDEGTNYEADTYITVDITLTMPDGTVLTAEKTDIDILIRFTCC